MAKQIDAPEYDEAISPKDTGLDIPPVRVKVK